MIQTGDGWRCILTEHYPTFSLLENDPDLLREAEQLPRTDTGEDEAAEKTTREPDQPAAIGGYSVTDGVICRQKVTGDCLVSVPLCNFNAQIVAEEMRDDGAEQMTILVLEGRLRDGTVFPNARVRSDNFQAMNWVMANWGTRAIVNAGQGNKDHLRAAIQVRSKSVSRRTVFAHIGWRKIGGEWLYLHAGGALGVLPDVSVDAGEGRLRDFILPAPPTGADLRAAVLASLSILDVAPQRITVPLFSAVYRAPLSEAAGVDYSVYFAGPTGAMKSELTALGQQHFGSGLERLNLPANWSATDNALEKLCFLAKDAVLVIDDFAPTGTLSDVMRLHLKADRVLRGQGNHAARGRMRPDGSLRPEYFPRGLVVSSGEDIPNGQSLGARMFVAEVAPGDVNVVRLTEAQRLAADGQFARAIAAYVSWRMCCNFQGCLAGDVKESRSDNPTRDLQMAADRTRTHPLCGPLVSSLFAVSARCRGVAGGARSQSRSHNGLALGTMLRA